MNLSVNDHPPDYVSGIDGLRGLAVLSVLVYHFDQRMLPGGFIGVDIFFVISGYVISKSLAANGSKTLSSFLLGFYRRRLLRILPALAICLMATVLVSSLFVPESWLSEANDTTGAYAFWGLSNFALISDLDGYFSERIAFNPFVHTWSLAVEEQFYLLFPLLLFFALKPSNWLPTGWPNASTLFLSLTLLSLADAAYTTSTDQPRAFYLLGSRFWELSVGAILYAAHYRDVFASRTKRRRRLVDAIGTSLLVLAFACADEQRFPFPWAIAPVLGTALLVDGLVAPVAGGSIVSSVLQGRLAGYVGKISYSLYLWHWPVLTLFRWTAGLASFGPILVSFAAMVILSTASYHFVELPVRNSVFLREMAPARAIALCLLALSLTFLAGKQVWSRPWRFNQSVTYQNSDWRVWRLATEAKEPPMPGRDFSQRNLFVVGDSHAGAYTLMADIASEHLGSHRHTLPLAGCPVVSLLQPSDSSQTCSRFVAEAMNLIETTATKGDVVFFASLRANRLGSMSRSYSDAEIERDWDSPAAQAARGRALEEADAIARRMEQLGLRVLIDAPKPVFRAPPFRCADWFNRMNPICAPGFTISRKFLERRRGPILESLRRLREVHPRVEIWDPFPLLCGETECSAFSGNRPLFFDGDHLSGYGNRVLAPSFEAVLLKLFESRD